MAIPEEDWTSHSLLAWTAPPDVAVEADCTAPFRELSKPGRRAGSAPAPLSHAGSEAAPRPVLAQLALFARYRTITHFITGAGGNGQHAGDWRPIGRRHSRGRERSLLATSQVRSSQMLESRSMPSGALRRVNGACGPGPGQVTGGITLAELTDMPASEAGSADRDHQDPGWRRVFAAWNTDRPARRAAHRLCRCSPPALASAETTSSVSALAPAVQAIPFPALTAEPAR